MCVCVRVCFFVNVSEVTAFDHVERASIIAPDSPNRLLYRAFYILLGRLADWPLHVFLFPGSVHLSPPLVILCVPESLPWYIFILYPNQLPVILDLSVRNVHVIRVTHAPNTQQVLRTGVTSFAGVMNQLPWAPCAQAWKICWMNGTV